MYKGYVHSPEGGLMLGLKLSDRKVFHKLL